MRSPERLNLFVRSDEQEQRLALGGAHPQCVAPRQHRPAAVCRRHLGPGRRQRPGGPGWLRLGRGTVSDMLDRIKGVDPRPAPRRAACGQAAVCSTRVPSRPCQWGELSERAHVSKPTVCAFAAAWGYDGLADFKRKLAGSVERGRALRAPRRRRGRQEQRHPRQGDRQRA